MICNLGDPMSLRHPVGYTARTHISAYVYIHIHIYIHTYTDAHKRTHAHIHIHTYIHTDTHRGIAVGDVGEWAGSAMSAVREFGGVFHAMGTHTHTHTHTYTHIHTHTHNTH